MRSAQSFWRRFHVAAAPFVMVAAIASCDVAPPTEVAPDRLTAQVNAGGVAFPVEVFVEAHQDDWELFAGNQTASSIQTAAKVVIVYVTAGDAGSAVSFPPYWQAREMASKAALDAITVAGDWACASVTLNAHAILRCTKANTVSYYMRLPDGNGEGQGYGFGSLALLRTGGIASLQAVDGTATYTSWADVRSTLQALVVSEATGYADIEVAVHAHDWDLSLNESDHSDHRTTGDLLREAAVGRAWNRFWYIGYASLLYPANLTPAEHDLKWQAILAYDGVMLALMGETIIGTSHAEEWSERTIYRSELSDGTPTPPIPPAAPRAPTLLLTATVSSSRIDLAWTDNASDEQGFRIERAPDVAGVSGAYAEIGVVAANVRAFSSTALTSGTRYWYRVRAYNGLGNSGYSNEASATTLPGPAAPTNLQAVALSSSVVGLTWVDNASDETIYRVERALDVGGAPSTTWNSVVALGANVTSYSVIKLSPTTTYWFRVRAENASANSAYAAAAPATTTAFAAPSGLTARTSLIGKKERHAFLSWTRGSELTVDIYRNGDRIANEVPNNGGPFDDKLQSSATGPTFTYQVCAGGKAGAGNCSSVVSVTF